MPSSRRRKSGTLLATVLLAFVTPVLAGGLVVVETHLSDDGDDDGFADTRETVNLQLTLQNTTGAALDALTVRLTTAEPWIACISVDSVFVGDLAADETRTIGPFVFTVADLDRTSLGLGPFDLLQAVFDVNASASPAAPRVTPPRIAFDLDLDVTGGSGATTLVESFEGSLGAFEIQNLDAGKNSMEATDGWRCQYSDPAKPARGACDPYSCLSDCSLGVSEDQAAAEFWSLSGPGLSSDGGRAFSGTHSLYFGFDLGQPAGFTTPLAVLEAVATSDPIYLGWDGPAPSLSFVHQVSLIDGRTLNGLDEETFDRAVVFAQVADEQDDPVGPWIKIYPHQNLYDRTVAYDSINWCMFDPADDGNDEDDTFADNVWAGPSSTCAPEFVFANSGETSLPFDPANLGLAEGPGLQGQSGVGTWVESRFDLSRFGGRRVRLRFLATTFKIQHSEDETWEDYFATSSFYPQNPVPVDDGWWIDDVTVSGALENPAIVTADTKDNSHLAGPPGEDIDGDTLFAVCDNCDLAFNPDQTDGDFDEVGDACDYCAGAVAAEDDVDCDGIADDLDNCATAHNPDQGSTIRLHAFGSHGFARSPDGRWTLTGMDRVLTLGGHVPERYVEPGMDLPSDPFEERADYRVSPDGSRIVYVARPEYEHDYGVFSASLSGDDSTRIAAIADYSALFCPWMKVCSPFVISPDGSTVVYVFDGGELRSVPIRGGSPALLADVANYLQFLYDITPDSSTVVFTPIQFRGRDLHGVPIDGGSLTLLSRGDEEVNWFRISADGAYVVYGGKKTGEVFELYSVPIGGGSPTKLNGPATAGFPPSGDRPFEISPDGSTVVYVIDQDAAEIPRLYSVPIGGGAITDLSGSPSNVQDFAITPDGTTVVYSSRQGPGPLQLWTVPIGGGTPTKLIQDFTAGAWEVQRFLVSPDGSTVVYLSDQETGGVVELRVVPIGGSLSTKLNEPLPAGSNVVDFRISPDGATVAYRVFGDPLPDDLFTVPIGGGVSTNHNGSIPLGTDLETVANFRQAELGFEAGFGFTPDSSALLFVSYAYIPFEEDDWELHVALLEPDLDGDGLLDACDVCPDEFDPGQEDFDGDRAGDLCDCAPDDVGSFAAPEEIRNLRAAGPVTFRWDPGAANSGAGTRYVLMRGVTTELPVGAGVSESCVDSGLAATIATDVGEPAAAAAFYYLVRGSNACDVGTYGFDSASSERVSSVCP